MTDMTDKTGKAESAGSDARDDVWSGVSDIAPDGSRGDARDDVWGDVSDDVGGTVRDAPRGTRNDPRGGVRDGAPGHARNDPRGGARNDARGGSADPLGGAVEEAFKLFDSLQQRAARELGKSLVRGAVRDVRGTVGGVFGGGGGGGGGRTAGRDVWEEAVSGHDEYICRACPVCRAKADRRDRERESGVAVTDHLVQAGSELFAAFRTAVDGLNRPSPAQRARERRRDETPVEHIDLG
ncbi:hypothetical protein ACFYSC_01275 [Streptosporangium sp. NPDC004379]|uniref:hypothetical protein n=1 Tax=Streptosporangium sp. NPDC004379 TaxID=3366189 RepID=UPI00369CDD3F